MRDTLIEDGWTALLCRDVEAAGAEPLVAKAACHPGIVDALRHARAEAMRGVASD